MLGSHFILLGLTLYMLCIFMKFVPGDIFKTTFSNNSFRNTIRVSNGLDPGQDQRSVGLDLGLNCLQML